MRLRVLLPHHNWTRLRTLRQRAGFASRRYERSQAAPIFVFAGSRDRRACHQARRRDPARTRRWRYREDERVIGLSIVTVEYMKTNVDVICTGPVDEPSGAENLRAQNKILRIVACLNTNYGGDRRDDGWGIAIPGEHQITTLAFRTQAERCGLRGIKRLHRRRFLHRGGSRLGPAKVKKSPTSHRDRGNQPSGSDYHAMQARTKTGLDSAP